METETPRIIAVGDIHGCSAALDALIQAIGPRPEDTLVTLGDYINRGPDSRGVPLSAPRTNHRRLRTAEMNTLDALDADSLRDDIPDFRPGDSVKVHVRVVEGNRSRIQVFQGVVIRRQGGGIRETFTVRKVSFGVGVERTFPVHTPVVEKIEVVTRGDVRRAKLYYLRELRGKAAKIKEKRETIAR